MTHVAPNRALGFWLIAFAGCGADLLTKSLAFDRMGSPGANPPWWLWESYVGVETSLNYGALFGLGQGKVWLFASLSCIAIAGICYWLYFAGAAADRMLSIALALVMGGILGNLHDRLGLWELPDLPGVREYAVRDWILFRWGDRTWPNFNVADSLLVCGVAVLVWHAFRHDVSRASTNSKPAIPPA